MSPVGRPKLQTLDDLLAIPEALRFHELIEGSLSEKEAASGKHGQAQTRVGRRLDGYDRRSGPPDQPGGWLFATEVETYFDEGNTFRPDVAGWRRERLPEMPAAVPIRVTPDWTCEILSTNWRNDLFKKKRISHRHKVGHYWILDPVAEELFVYRWAPDDYVEVATAGAVARVRAEPFEAVELSISYLFGADE